MGTGKSMSTITMFNENPDGRYIYITPYLEEAERIKNGCPELNFVEPKNLREFNGSKLLHTQELVSEGRNIATTHQAFKNYTSEMLEAIRKFGYTLVIDENVDVLGLCDFHDDDIQIAVNAGSISYDGDKYSLVDRNYNGTYFHDMFKLLASRPIMRIDDPDVDENGKRTLFYWVLPPELITSFKDVYILTYLFEGQGMDCFLKMYNIPYTRIGIERTSSGNGFRFCDYPGYIPEYVNELRNMIEIVDDRKLNSVGDRETALSKRWFTVHKNDEAQTLRNNVYNIFHNIWKDSEPSERMWATFKSSKDTLKGRGFTNNYTVINMRATNKYRTALYLAYVCNIYMSVDEKRFYTSHGFQIDEDRYALSIMLQWIWRSAIRDGQKIHIYLPSSRMRRILIDWMDSLEKGGCADGNREDMRSMSVL